MNLTDQMTVTADVSQVHTVTGFVNRRLEALGCSERIKAQVDVAIDELFSNIAHYAYHPDTGPATVMVEVEDRSLPDASCGPAAPRGCADLLTQDREVRLFIRKRDLQAGDETDRCISGASPAGIGAAKQRRGSD